MNQGSDDVATVFQDAAGQAHRPAGEAARVVSLVPSLTELMFTLGLDEALVGRTTYCIEPAGRVEAVASVGGTKKINMAKLAALRPSHVLVNVDENTEAMATEIAQTGVAVVVTHPLVPEDNVALFRLIGGLFGRAAEAEALVQTFEAELEATQAAIQDYSFQSALYLIWRNPWMTVSRDTYVSAMLALAGLETLCHDPDRRYPEVEVTPDLLAVADAVLFSSEPYAFGPADIEAFRAEHGIAERPRLLAIDGQMTSWYGSRAIAGLRYLRDFAAKLDG
ncbi:MAG: helical backbone metal receptor [Alphaproteobacteria bacterium]|jgi:ABC-type Fe3+-hydroxamate transport system substrate-binding protein|nr:helical backbone metal receptor [Alphaproteobacteria bacterium]